MQSLLCSECSHYYGVRYAVSAVSTMDNAKIFSQLISKSRSLAKISERKLQPLLVCEIIN